MDRYNPPNHTLPDNTRLTAGPAPLRGGRNPDEPRDRGCAAPLSNAREGDPFGPCDGCRLSDDHCDGMVQSCGCTCGWDEHWAEQP